MINFDELFKNHQATRTDCGPLSIITYKKPDSFENGLRYIFDNELSTLTITGDWLKAVAVNVNNHGLNDLWIQYSKPMLMAHTNKQFVQISTIYHKTLYYPQSPSNKS